MPFVYMDELSGLGELGKKKKKGIFGKLKKVVGKVLKLTPIGMAATFAKRQFMDKPKKAKKKAAAAAAAAEAEAYAPPPEAAPLETEAPIMPTTNAYAGVPGSAYAPPPPMYPPAPPYPEQYPIAQPVDYAPPPSTQMTAQQAEEEEAAPSTLTPPPELYPELYRGGGEEGEGEGEGMEGVGGYIITRTSPPYAVGYSRKKGYKTSPFRRGARRVPSLFNAPVGLVEAKTLAIKKPGRFTSPFYPPNVEMPQMGGLGANEASDETRKNAFAVLDQYRALIQPIADGVIPLMAESPIGGQIKQLEQSYIQNEVRRVGLDAPYQLLPTNADHAVIIATRSVLTKAYDDFDRLRASNQTAEQKRAAISLQWTSAGTMADAFMEGMEATRKALAAAGSVAEGIGAIPTVLLVAAVLTGMYFWSKKGATA